MRSHDLPNTAPYKILRWTLLIAVLFAMTAAAVWFLQDTIPRHIVFASGPNDGMYHEWADRYKAILARDGVTVDVRITGGAVENERLLLDPKSGVDVAIMMGGVIRPKDRGNIVMIAALYYEPLWIFYRASETLTEIDELRYKRVANGSELHGVRAFTEPLLAANNITGFNTQFAPLDNVAAIRALQSRKLDAAMVEGHVEAPAVWQGLNDPTLKLMSIERVDAYQRRFPYIKSLILPAGTIDFARHIPERDVKLIGTKAMLVARDTLSPAIIHLLLDAARELHGEQGYFEADDEFPNTGEVDLPVSSDAIRHLHFGPSLLHRYLPFSLATYLERLIVLLVPLLVVIVPLVNFLPQVLRWRVRSRIYRWYGELTLLERDVNTRTGNLPVDQWLADLSRIEQSAEQIKTPTSYASEAYTLREHIRLVRQTVMAKAQSGATAS